MLNMHSFAESTSGDFTIRTFGEGSPVTVCVGGISYAPSDFYAFADGLIGTTHVVDNPIHSGKVDRKTDWQEWLRSQYARLFRELDGEFFVAHSSERLDPRGLA